MSLQGRDIAQWTDVVLRRSETSTTRVRLRLVREGIAIKPYSALLIVKRGALVFFWLGLSLNGQTDLQRRPPPASEYVLGSGDQIVLRVTDVEEIPDKPLVIDPSGFVDLPLVGRVEADGLTLTAFKTNLVKKFGVFINDPDISVNLVSSGSEPIAVRG